MGFRLSEESVPDYQLARPYQERGPMPGQRIDKLREQIRRQGARRARAAEELIAQPYESYKAESDRQYQQAMKEAQLVSEEQAQDMNRLQAEAAKRQAELDEEFARPEREQRMEQQETATELQRAQAEQADIATRTARDRAEMMGETVPETGRTYLQEQVAAPIEQQREQMALARRQEDRAQRQAELNAETTKLQQSKARMNIDEAERERRVRDLTAQIAGTPDGPARAEMIRQLSEQGKASEVASALSQVKNQESRSRYMAMLQPQNQNRVQRAVAGKQELDEINALHAEMSNYLDDIKNESITDAARMDSVEQLAQTLEQLGSPQSAADVRKILDFSFDGITTQHAAAKKAVNRVLRHASSEIMGKYSDFPEYVEYGRKLKRMSRGVSPIESGNIFDYNAGQPQTLRVPDVADPLASQSQPPQQQRGQPVFKNVNGEMQMVQQPVAQGDRIQNILSQGRQRQPTEHRTVNTGGATGGW